MIRSRRIGFILGLAGGLWLGGAASAATFVVENAADSGPGSLREAITSANTNPGPDNISFDIPPASSITLLLQTPLPIITEAATIDGYTQSGATANTSSNGINASLIINIAGPLVNLGHALHVKSSGCTIRGLAIYGFSNGGTFTSGDAVFIDGGNSNVVEGCFIGTDSSGTNGLRNLRGVEALGGSGNRIGGSAPAQRNIIANSFFDGVVLTGSTGTRITGNFIGTDVSGTNTLVIGDNGVLLQDASDTTVSDNLIAGCSSGGVFMNGAGASNNVVTGNIIGGAVVPNGNFGVRVSDGFSNSIHNNTIIFNDGPGVSILGGTGNSILGNSISDNTALGINLLDDGVTANDPLDADSGPNNTQNFPVLTSAGAGSAVTIVEGSLQSAPVHAYRLEFFASPLCDGSGHGQGQRFLGSSVVTTDTGGNRTFSVALPAVVNLGDAITATATDESGNTSEFSACVQADQLSCAGDISSLVTVRIGKVLHNVRAGRFYQRVTIQNATDSQIDITPIYLALDELTPNVTLVNRAGLTDCALPLNSPFVVVTTVQLKAKKRVRALLEYSTKSKECIIFTPRVLAGPVKP